jgi:excisionase family DNA binding protein
MTGHDSTRPVEKGAAMQDAGRRLLKVPEAADYVGLTVRGLYRMFATGRLKPVRFPGVRRTLVDRDDLDALVEATRARTTSSTDSRM